MCHLSKENTLLNVLLLQLTKLIFNSKYTVPLSYIHNATFEQKSSKAVLDLSHVSCVFFNP